MNRIAVIAAALVVVPGGLLAQDPHLERARRILSEVPLIDGHNDLPGAFRDAATGGLGDVAAYDLPLDHRGRHRFGTAAPGNGGRPVLVGARQRQLDQSRATTTRADRHRAPHHRAISGPVGTGHHSFGHRSGLRPGKDRVPVGDRGRPRHREFAGCTAGILPTWESAT